MALMGGKVPQPAHDQKAPGHLAQGTGAWGQLSLWCPGDSTEVPGAE